MKQIINLFGETTSTTGQPGLQSVSQFSIPQGAKLKIYRIAVDGNAAVITLQYTPNAAASSPTWYPVEQITTTAAGHLVDEYKTRPLVLYGMAGTEAIQVTYSQSTVGGTAVAILAEMSEEEEED